EELKLTLSLTKPKFFVPIHGEYRHLVLHSALAQTMGVPKERSFILEDGEILELSAEGGRKVGRVPAGNVYVDGLSVGGVDSVVLRSRKMLSQDGIVVAIIALNEQTGRLVTRPDIVSRGFVDPDASQRMLDESRDAVAAIFEHDDFKMTEWSVINTRIRDVLSKFYYDQTHRRP